MLLRRFIAKKMLKKQVKVKDVYTIYSINNLFGQPVSAPMFKEVRY